MGGSQLTVGVSEWCENLCPEVGWHPVWGEYLYIYSLFFSVLLYRAVFIGNAASTCRFPTRATNEVLSYLSYVLSHLLPKYMCEHIKGIQFQLMVSLRYNSLKTTTYL